MDVAKLGALTVSTLAGREGRQRKEIAKLLRWLKTDVRPSVVHLSNVMLAGMAPALRERAAHADSLHAFRRGHLPRATHRAALQPGSGTAKAPAQCVDRFVALNHYFADFMSEYLAVNRDKIEVIPHGLNLAGHEQRGPRESPRELTIGYFARVAAEKGLHILADAFCLLALRDDLPRLRLHAAGYMSSRRSARISIKLSGGSARPDSPTASNIGASWIAPGRFGFCNRST